MVGEQECKDAFNFCDKNRSGRLDASAAADAMRCLGKNPTKKELAKVFSSVGKGQKNVDYSTFMQMFNAVPNKKGQEKEMIEAFRVFDARGEGAVGALEVRRALTSFGEKLSEAEVEEMLGEIRIDADGKFKYAEFVKKLMSSYK
ncbi:hypothetical protein SNEBB_002541 [Seison nebaliae]|nr:hypothetical protein SNEBB_002541 [Seison nebaliae]